MHRSGSRCHIAFLPALLICLFAAGGCGGSDGPQLAQVEGTVTMDGKPLPNATVAFQPTGDEGSPSVGETDEQGRYELRFTFKKAGAMVGEHIVEISTAGERYDEETDEEIRSRETVPARYNVNARENPDMKVTVESGSNTIDFTLDSKGKIIDDPDSLLQQD